VSQVKYFSGDKTPFMDFDRECQEGGLAEWMRQWTQEERDLMARAGHEVPAGTLVHVRALAPGVRTRQFIRVAFLDESKDGMVDYDLETPEIDRLRDGLKAKLARDASDDA
jgi:hypothetical protein